MKRTSSSNCPFTIMMLILISACSGGNIALRGGSWPGPSTGSSSPASASHAAAAGTAAHMLPLRPVAVPVPATTNTVAAQPPHRGQLYALTQQLVLLTTARLASLCYFYRY